MLKINQAQPVDIPELCRLLAILFKQEKEFQPDSHRQQRGLQLIIENPLLGAIWVARQELQIVGMVSLLYSVSTALGGRVATLEDMLVDTNFRDRQIGSRLLAHAINAACEAGCLRVSLLTDRDNLKAQAFYEKQGFVHSDMQQMRLLFD